MDLKIEGSPGSGNTFQEIHIGYVETYAPAATTIVNYHYSDGRRHRFPSDASSQNAETASRHVEIMQYVGRLKSYVAPSWSHRYEAVWQSILGLPEVSSAICEPGKQKGTPFNRNLVAGIICMMCEKGIIAETNATTLAVALEGDKDHPVRGRLRMRPSDSVLGEKIDRLLE